MGAVWVLIVGWCVPASALISACAWAPLLAWRAKTYDLSWRDGLWWGWGVVTVPLVTIAWGCARLLCGPFVLVMGLLLMISLLVGAVYGILWYALGRVGAAVVCGLSSERSARTLGFLVGTYVWWLILLWWGLWWLGSPWGLPFVSPVIALGSVAWLRPWLVLVGHEGVLFVVMVVGWLWGAGWWRLRSIRWLMGGGVVCLVLSAFLRTPRPVCAVLPWCAHLPLSMGSRAQVHEVYTVCSPLLTAQKGVGATPESAVYTTVPWAQYITEKGPAGGGTMFVGGFRPADEEVFNTVWWFYQGRCIDFFDKRLVMPGVETVPWKATWAPLRRMCLGDLPEVKAGMRPRPLWQIEPGVCVVPYICGELFCAMYPSDGNEHAAILGMCNTAWAPQCLVRRLELYVTWCSVVWQRPIYCVTSQQSMLYLP